MKNVKKKYCVFYPFNVVMAYLLEMSSKDLNYFLSLTLTKNINDVDRNHITMCFSHPLAY